MNRAWIALSLALVGGVAACASETGDAWWEGQDEPDYPPKADGSTPLTIYLGREQPNLRTILSTPEMGNIVRSRTGILNIDGSSLTNETVLIIQGEFFPYEGGRERHLLVAKPRYVTKEEGAYTDGGFLRLDLKSASNIRVYEQSGSQLGTKAGVFRGQIIATTALTLDQRPDDDLSVYYLRPRVYNQRPPNLLANREIYFRPNVALVRLKPHLDCFGRYVVDTTLAQEELEVAIGLDGFPSGREVEVAIRYRFPHNAAGSVAGHLWDYISGIFASEYDEVEQKRRVRVNSPTQMFVSMDAYRTLAPAWGDDLYAMEIEVEARQTTGSGAYSGPYSHQLKVVNRGEQVLVDQFELCPPGDDACRALRDQYAPDNVIARRVVLEEIAEMRGLYNTITRPVGRCEGGDRVGGSFTDDCRVYRESQDTEVSFNVEAELNFELNVNGNAQGRGSWMGSLPGGLASAEIEAAFKAAFSLDVELHASFETSRTWIDRHSLDVVYDPRNTQIQWWRVVTPRLRFLELAEFDACGQRLGSNEIYLSDLTNSRLVLACEEVPSYNTVCHAVEPSDTTVANCDRLLIPVDSARGQMCLMEEE